MPPIVSDTTPINYLILIEAIDVLPQLYGRILIPETVRAELLDPNAPAEVRSWVMQPLLLGLRLYLFASLPILLSHILIVVNEMPSPLRRNWKPLLSSWTNEMVSVRPVLAI